jgi:hypothetical protein
MNRSWRDAGKELTRGQSKEEYLDAGIELMPNGYEFTLYLPSIGWTTRTGYMTADAAYEDYQRLINEYGG